MIAGWTSKQYYRLETLFRAQMPIKQIASELGKTISDVERMMKARDLTISKSIAKTSFKKVDITDARYQPNPDRAEALFGDKMFKMAMLRAIKAGDEFETLERAARLMLAAGFTTESHRLRVYVLIGYPKDTFELAEGRLKQMIGIGFTPMAMLWSPDKPSQERYRPAPEWKAFQRRWARPAIIHAKAEGAFA